MSWGHATGLVTKVESMNITNVNHVELYDKCHPSENVYMSLNLYREWIAFCIHNCKINHKLSESFG